MESFEKKLGKLKNIVEELESGKLDLDKSIQKFQEGTGLIKECHEQLEQVKKQITILVEDSEGNITEEEFESDEEE